MKKNILILLLTFLVSFALKAQKGECGTNEGTIPYIFSKAKQDSINSVLAINTPYCIRVYITVFADNDGTNRAATDADILRQFQNMVNQYQPHNICFMLINIKQVNNTDLNTHNYDTESSEVSPYVQSGCLNIFLHNYLDSNDGTLNGVAYGIPSTILSEASWAIESTTNISTMGHEAGHCLSLYHTFSTSFGAENVTRNPANSCYDCDADGDLLCDTPADKLSDPDDDVNSSCLYIGGRTDACGVVYTPMTNNMMAYGFRPCRDTFTSGQGNRMRSAIVGTPALTALINEDIKNSPSSNNSLVLWNNNEGFETARDALYISNFTNDGYSVTGSAVRRFISKKVYLKPGTHFYPTTGKVHVKTNPYCN
ncbi:M43 family zinc metalloprotease [Emticicia sp. SJ17W-69]|uniref:M43 family zinc metalloprotease n=1 Tax=Emticicia sp. SJ17W-69 TaxID=3421657 RepID=UPI003EBFBEE4